MTLHEPKHPNPGTEAPQSQRPRTRKKERRESPPLTLGHLLGAEIRAVQAERARRAELDEMGFKPLGGA